MLFTKQVRVGTSCCGRKNKFVFKNLIHQKPVRFYIGTHENHSDFQSTGGLCIFAATDFQKQEGSKLQQVFLNSCLFSSSVWRHVSFDLYRQSRTNQSSSIEATASCAVLKGPCRFVRFRLSETAVSNESGSALCLTAKGSPLFSIEEARKIRTAVEVSSPSDEKRASAFAFKESSTRN